MTESSPPPQHSRPAALPEAATPTPPASRETQGPPSSGESARTMGLVGATGVGIGAIVGGGILVLAGVAFRYAGPSAMLAFLFNGILAVLTALSFAEVSTRFPESGGVYTFAKKLLSVRAAFAVGWILWFAYIVAGVLYAMGFASYAVELLRIMWTHPPAWVESRTTTVLFALGPTLYYAFSLLRQSSGGGQWATWGKVVVFLVVVLVGAVQFVLRDWHVAARQLTPYFPNGFSGMMQAMGLTFIALQGFDLISAVAGEVKDPERNIPRAMLISLAAGIAIYVPLVFIVSTVGTPPDSTITAMSATNPETVMARAAKLFMGPIGYWLVMIAALLSTLSALQANMLAASRVALSMAEDRTLPAFLATVDSVRRTPHMAIYATTLTLVALLLAVPDLAAAGSAASLIFLIAFTFAHYTAILARRRGQERPSQNTLSILPGDWTAFVKDNKPPPFEAPFFPAIPILGGLACAAMAAFQAFAEPAAGGIALVWLGFGGLLYAALFSNRAETYDAFAEAYDPDLAKMRGRSPLVLVPVANPSSAKGMVEVAAALAPPRVGRVMLLRVMAPPDDQANALEGLEQAQRVMAQALQVAWHSGHRPEGLVTVATRPWHEIGRVVRSHLCQGLVVGLPGGEQQLAGSELETLINSLDCDVTLVRCDQGWSPSGAQRLLVPIGVRGHELEMRARVLGSLQTRSRPEITWITVIPSDSTSEHEAMVRRKLLALARDNVFGDPILLVERSDSAAATIAKMAPDYDLLVLGMHRGDDGKRLFGEFNQDVLSQTTTPALVISGAVR